MASHRIGARVAGLSPAQLCAIIEAQAGASDAALRVAEEHAARLVEQPEWVLSEVLLSPDLAPHILAQLPTTEHAAKGTMVKSSQARTGHQRGVDARKKISARGWSVARPTPSCAPPMDAFVEPVFGERSLFEYIACLLPSQADWRG
ncbi:hypothetical protein EMIHUDRAFT_205249 [Emiliania huxleyi CCMP1516]|uniref:Uncharacterized protein n=2 Tax=Emiliania huxleyi TaxID=2903 RepID=A0A0D3JUQ9_EMIH1|nr:hypothetical protein EMIHUDRAFT_205249 [Emiliania huxleyi CCMP1516]EOD27244.1 hypothetical protein EMIHUDRAFT_205249 [Emiliania huxleyi CCMP1516]|eukprot:XP_005779673.1 hypothetical protein EMIHUDRAFT_205249 [Emiliania huxleyi CCMP1516]